MLIFLWFRSAEFLSFLGAWMCYSIEVKRLNQTQHVYGFEACQVKITLFYSRLDSTKIKYKTFKFDSQFEFEFDVSWFNKRINI